MQTNEIEIKLSGYVQTPNWVIEDVQMYDSTRMVLFALLCRIGSRMSVCISLDEIAAMTHLSRNTVAKAIRELKERGIVFATRRYYFSKRHNRVIRGKTRYHIRRCEGGNFTLVPRSILSEKVSPATFTVLLHTYRLSGRKGRCFPSLRRFAKQIDHAKATICRAIKKLHLRQFVNRQGCTKQNDAPSCNSYYPIGWVRKGAFRKSSDNSGLKFEHQQAIKKITEGSIKRKEEKGVGQFGTLTEKSEKWPQIRQFYFDGVGVTVSFGDELELLS